MKITDLEVKKVASLSKLDVGDINNIEEDMQKIIDMFDKLSELDIKVDNEIDTDIKNVFRKDEVTTSYSGEKLIANAPSKEMGGVSVPKIVE